MRPRGEVTAAIGFPVKGQVRPMPIEAPSCCCKVVDWQPLRSEETDH